MLLPRDKWKAAVFKRDGGKCVVCGEPAVDAHHIIDRGQFEDGGYYLENGVSLCSKNHIRAEKGELSCEELRTLAGIKIVILPPKALEELGIRFDKWGKGQID